MYKFASDVYADQSIEIARMKQMLQESPGSPAVVQSSPTIRLTHTLRGSL